MKREYQSDLNEDMEPKPGDIIKTKKMQMQGKVEKVEPYSGYMAVYFRLEDGRLMRTALHNVTVIEKLADSEVEEVSEGFPYDVDHMPGRVIRGEFENKTVRYFYNEWKELADRANSEQHSNGLIISSGPKTVIYQSDDGTIYAQWDKQKNVGFIKGKTTEGSMGGINRSAPAQDVSYEKVLDEVMSKWSEACRTDELSVDTMQRYQKAVTSPAAVRTRPLRKLAKSVVGFKQAGDKIDAKTGDRSGSKPKHGPINSRHGATYEERLSEFMTFEDDFGDIVRKQDNSPKPGQTTDKQYNGWVIRYQLAPKSPGQPIQWMTWHSKKGPETAKRGTSSTPEKAFQDATAFINSGGDAPKEFNPSSKVMIAFNVHFTRQIVPRNSEEPFYAKIEDGFILVSLSPKEGFSKATHYRGNMENEKYYHMPISTASAQSQKLVPNGRYTLGSKEEIDSETWMFDIHFQNVASSINDKLRMGEPGFIVATSRNEVSEDSPCWKNYKQVGMKTKGGKQVPNCVPKTNEVYQGPWQGDPQKYAKAPKSSTVGNKNVRLSDLVKDTIETHGVKWAFEFYVKKHGMPPRHFRIFAGI